MNGPSRRFDGNAIIELFAFDCELCTCSVILIRMDCSLVPLHKISIQTDLLVIKFEEFSTAEPSILARIGFSAKLARKRSFLGMRSFMADAMFVSREILIAGRAPIDLTAMAAQVGGHCYNVDHWDHGRICREKVRSDRKSTFYRVPGRGVQLLTTNRYFIGPTSHHVSGWMCTHCAEN